MFLSEGDKDGYVSFINVIPYTPATAFWTGPQPGLRAGQGFVLSGGTSPDLQAFLSLVTGPLSGAKVLGAKLRLKQTSTNDAFDSLGSCMVDIVKGTFSGNPALESFDVWAAATETNVSQA